MTNSIVLQRFTRVSLLGIDVEARTDLADEPVIEADSLGQLLEYERSRKCRELVRRLLDDGRLSWRSPHSGATGNEAQKSTLVTNGLDSMATVTRPVDVFVVTEREQVGTVVRDVDKLWLTERACLLVATASETERAWQVRTALVDFFLACRRERTNPTGLSPTVVHEVLAARDEVRQLHADITAKLDLDARVRKLETRHGRSPAPLMAPKVPLDPRSAFDVSVRELLGKLRRDEEISIPEILQSLGLEFADWRARRIGLQLSHFGWVSVRRERRNCGQVRVYQWSKAE